MTSEERMKLIKHLQYSHSIGADYSITDKDADEIIKALEQESSDDCISRKAVLAMSDFVGERPTYSTPFAELEEVVRVKDIEALPPITPQLHNVINIPKDVTNGEALCMLFPNMHYTLSDKSPRVVTTIGVASSFDIDWWNAPYKIESEDNE